MKIEAILSHLGLSLNCVPMTKSLQAAVKLMHAEMVDAVLVTDHCATEGRAVFGLLTRGDVIDAMNVHGMSAFAMPISKLAAGRFVVCDQNEPLTRVISMMESQSAAHVLVMEGDQTVSLITAADILFFTQNVAPTTHAVQSLVN